MLDYIHTGTVKVFDAKTICEAVGGAVMKLVTVLLPEAYIEGLEELVRSGMYPSRSAAIRTAVRDLVKTELWADGR